MQISDTNFHLPKQVSDFGCASPAMPYYGTRYQKAIGTNTGFTLRDAMLPI